MRLRLSFALLCLLLGAASQAFSKQNAPPDTVATVIALDGQSEWQDGQTWKPVALGQLFGPGDRLRCGMDSSMQWVVDGILSVALDADTTLTLPTQASGPLTLNLNRGRIGCFADPGLVVKIHTGNAMIQAGPGAIDLEAAAVSQNTLLNTAQIGAQFGDPARLRTLDLAPFSSAVLVMDRLLGPDSLSKRDISEMNARWERARVFFGQRSELLKAMRAMPEHAGFMKALHQRLMVH
jgi:hypothetical protein